MTHKIHNYIIGLAKNAVLERLGKSWADQAQERFQQSKQKQRIFGEENKKWRIIQNLQLTLSSEIDTIAELTEIVSEDLCVLIILLLAAQ